jgi:hypothetical protein
VIGCICLLLAACGGTAKQGSIRRPAALRLAGESDAVRDALRAGDACLAAERAHALRTHVSAAVAAGSIPPSLAAAARAASSRLAADISCTRPPPPPAMPPAATPPAPPPPACPKGKDGKGRGKHGGEEGHQGDEQGKGCE